MPDRKNCEVVEIRKVRPGDESGISIVACDSWHFTYKDIYDDAYIDDWISRNYSENVMREHVGRILDDQSYIFLVAVRMNEIIGFSETVIRLEEAWLLRIYLRPAEIRKGIGVKLLQTTETEISGNGVGLLRTAVQQQNRIGLSFYLKNGFEIINSTPEDEFIMAKILRNA